MTPLATLRAGKASSVAVNAGTPPLEFWKKMALAMAAPIAGETSPVVVDTGTLPVKIGENLATIMSALGVGKVSPRQCSRCWVALCEDLRDGKASVGAPEGG